jgi:cyclic-di-GMP phosphodiesterase TipF (flagellum assembly factor)
MTAIRRPIVFVVGVVIAVLAGVLLPVLMPFVSNALSIGLATFALVAVIYQQGAKSEVAIANKDRVGALYAGHRDLAEAFQKLREDNRVLRAALAEIGSEFLGDEHLLQRIKAEMRVMQSLKGQISPTHQKSTAGATGRPAGEQSGQPESIKAEETRVLDIISEALKHERVDLFLQPIMQLPDRKPLFYECYSRIRAADGSVVMPAQYMEVAKRCGLLQAIDNMLLFRCIQLVRKTQRQNHVIGFVCNISAQTLGDRRFFPEFLAFLSDNRGLASRVTFELSEEDVTAQWDALGFGLEKLAGLGFRFSMDRVKNLDFDPQQLASRHFKFVKVEVEDLLRRGADLPAFQQNLVRHRIGLVAEKVETPQQLSQLLDLKIPLAQGYLLGEPKLSRRD